MTDQASPGAHPGPSDPSLPSSGEVPRKSRRKALLVVAVAVVIAAVGTGGFFLLRSDSPQKHTIIGEMTVSGSDNIVVDTAPSPGQHLDENGNVVQNSSSDSSCSGTGGYDDLSEGGGVVVTSDGKTVALGELSKGTPGTDPSDDTVVNGCIFTFTIKDVPDRDFYEIEVTHRGKLTYSKAKLEAAGWLVFSSIRS